MVDVYRYKEEGIETEVLRIPPLSFKNIAGLPASYVIAPNNLAKTASNECFPGTSTQRMETLQPPVLEPQRR